MFEALQSNNFLAGVIVGFIVGALVLMAMFEAMDRIEESRGARSRPSVPTNSFGPAGTSDGHNSGTHRANLRTGVR